MTDAERTKFIKHLRKTMKTSTSATERMAATRLYAQFTGLDAPDRKATDGIELGPLPEIRELRREPTEFDSTALQATSSAPEGLVCLLMLVKPDPWMGGLWAETPEGWINKRDGERLLTWGAAQAMVADRIAELGLDAEKVYSYPKSHCSTAEYQAFLNLPFEQQMERFRA
jgi:hypothetical protein